MTQAHDGQALSPDLYPESQPSEAADKTARILVVDADSALLGLIEEWLADAGYDVVQEGAAGDLEGEYFDLVVVDVPFPRQGGLNSLRRIAAEHARTPVLALSSMFFAGIQRNGMVARTLGVASVLPKPVTRDALITTVRKLLRQ
jgi:DNA-binding response OmpR family regulator